MLDGLTNPFRATVVADPWQANQGDVPQIHGEAFALCRDALDAVRREGQTRSVVIYGEAGSGKTHLLRRFRSACTGEPPHEVDPIRPEVVFVAAKLQTSPKHLWRYLRQSLVEDLMRLSSDESTQLDRVLLRRLAEVRPADADLRMWFEWLQSVHPDPADLRATLDGLFDRLDHQVRMGRDLCTVLAHLLTRRHLRDAKAWLRGDPLPASAHEALGVAPPADDEEPEDRAREVVGALCRLAGPAAPVVFCFDQIEALQVDRRDTAALFAFGRVVMELFHQADNVLIVAAVQITFLDELREAMLAPAWDRLAMQRRAITPLRWAEASRLVAARLDADPTLQALRAGQADRPLWPLDEVRLRQRVGPVGETARLILAECADQFDAAQAGFLEAARPPDVPAALDAAWRERVEGSPVRADPASAGDVLAHGLPLLVGLVAPGWKFLPDPEVKDVHLLWSGPDGRVGVHLSSARDMRSVWRPLERLAGPLREGLLEKLVVVRDTRLPWDRDRVRAHRDALRAEGAVEVRPAPDDLAALDALRALLSDARSGDLTVGGRAIEPGAVAAWLAHRMPPALRSLATEVLAYPGVGAPAPAPAPATATAAAPEREASAP